MNIPSLVCLSVLCLYTAQSWGNCVANNGERSLNTISSMTLYENGLATTSFRAGLYCTSFNRSSISSAYFKYKVTQLPSALVHSNGDLIPIQLKDSYNNVLSLNGEKDLSSQSFLTAFDSEGHFPFVLSIPAGSSITPGKYTSNHNLNLSWYYSIPQYLGLLLFYNSPGFVRPIFGTPTTWGAGTPSSINISLEVLPDCRITTQDISFGTAPMASEFVPVQSTMGIRCASKTPYSVGLNQGLHQAAAGQRAMKASANNAYLQYELYKNHNQQRWGHNGTERWSSSDASSNAGILNGTTQQTYQFTAEVLPQNPNNLPADTYSDTITVDVTF